MNNDAKAAPKRGINFKETPGGKLMLIEPETFRQYLSGMHRNEQGLHVLKFTFLNFFSQRHLFAIVDPEGIIDFPGYTAPLSGIEFVRDKGSYYVVINEKAFFRYLEGCDVSHGTWKAFIMQTISESRNKTNFATIRPFVKFRKPEGSPFTR